MLGESLRICLYLYTYTHHGSWNGEMESIHIILSSGDGDPTGLGLNGQPNLIRSLPCARLYYI